MRILRTAILAIGLSSFGFACGGSDKKVEEPSGTDTEEAKEEMGEAKEEMDEAKEEMDEAKEEMDEAKEEMDEAEESMDEDGGGW